MRLSSPSSEANLAAARAVVLRLRQAGHAAYLAGGCVRDLLLGREPKDFDVATSAMPDVVLDLFPRTFAVGAHFGVVLVSAESDGQSTLTEVATFRHDGAYSDGRHPNAVRYTLSAEEDVQRRDFTINGLLLDLERLEGPAGLKFASETDPAAKEPIFGGFVKAPDVRRQSIVGEIDRASHAEAIPASEGFVTGHDFSRADNAKTRNGALAPEGSLDGDRPGFALFPSAEKAPLKAAIQMPTGNPELSSSAVLDFVGGLNDLQAGVVRAIGNPERRFEEDRLRMLRAVRFASRFGFQIEPATLAAIRALAPKILTVSQERVRDELTRLLTEGQARRAFELLDSTGLLPHILPEVARLKGVAQPPEFHPEGDVWTHTLMLLQQLQPGCPMTLAWGALLHDIGKPATFQPPTGLPDGVQDRIRFSGHVEVGVRIGSEICRRLRFSNEETTQILALIENHMRFADVRRMKDATLKRFFRLERFSEHLALHQMDCRASSLDLSGNLENYHFAKERFEAMPPEQVRPAPLLTGQDLIAAGYAPGPAFKAMLRAVEEAQLEGTIHGADDAMTLVKGQFSPPEKASG